MSERVTVVGVPGVPEVGTGADLAALVCTHAPDLADGDVVVVTSKAVSKAEGRVRRAEREATVAAETVRVVARRGPTTIARTAQGLTLAAAGVDASNTEAGTVVLLPVDPDASARRLRVAIRERGGHNVAVVVSDTAGRPWREGQTDIAVGCAGLTPLDDHAGRRDSHGHELSVTAPALADEVTGAADLVMGKSAGRPVAVVRGMAEHVLAPDTDGPGAAALLRPEGADMFVLGAREAVLAAVCRDDPTALALLTASSGRPAPVHDLVERAGGRGALEARDLGAGEVEVHGPAGPADPADPDSVVTLAAATALERVCALAAVHGWRVAADDRNRGVCRIVLRSGPAGP